ncbi:PaaI family thioesterase [bacterium SCSIO 12741]|nr:PaaI family thioesterase [bacterium SCSIO 12741]
MDTAKRIIEQYKASNRFGDFLGMDFTLVAPGQVNYSLPLKPEFEALPGTTHGGLIAALMDGLLGVTALSAVADAGCLVSTVEFKINYLNPAKTGSILEGKGQVIRQGKRLQVVEGEIKVGDLIIAKAMGTFNVYPAR